jgi:hypothetical protein
LNDTSLLTSKSCQRTLISYPVLQNDYTFVTLVTHDHFGTGSRLRVDYEVRAPVRTMSETEDSLLLRHLDIRFARRRRPSYTTSFTMASRAARQITALVAKQGNAVAQRTYHASSSQIAGMSPPLPPFTRIPRESGSVRLFVCFDP